MKRIVSTGSIRVLTLGAAFAAAGAAAGEQAVVEADEAGAAAVTVEAEVALVSSYLWRGQLLNDRPVLQPAATIAAHGYSLNVWANANLTDRVGDSRELNEVDLALAYGRTVGLLDLEAGWIEYLFPNTPWIRTREVYLCAGVSKWPVAPSLTLYYDLDEVDSCYAVAALEYSHELSDTLALELFASLGYGAGDYNDYYFGDGDGALNDATFGATLVWAVSDALALQASCAYTVLPDPGIRRAAANAYFDDHALVAGLTAAYAF